MLSGRGLVGAIIFYRSLCNDKCSRVDRQRLLAFTDFFFSTFMRHYRLYRCVMSKSPQRENITSSLVLPVHGPPQPIQPLSKGVAPDVWEYENAVRELEKTCEEMKRKRCTEKYRQEKEEAQQLARVQCRVSDLDPVNSEVRNIFTALRYASTLCCRHVSVRPYVCPSEASIYCK